MKTRMTVALVMGSLLLASTALAAGPARRAARHSQVQTLEMQRITGRSMRPHVVIDIKKQEHHFAIGTAHLSPSYARFAKPGDPR
jgi:hypothetical protein